MKAGRWQESSGITSRRDLCKSKFTKLGFFLEVFFSISGSSAKKCDFKNYWKLQVKDIKTKCRIWKRD